jgi:hypothetical protein
MGVHGRRGAADSPQLRGIYLRRGPRSWIVCVLMYPFGTRAS